MIMCFNIVATYVDICNVLIRMRDKQQLNKGFQRGNVTKLWRQS